MVKERQQEMNYVENDYKVESVQDRFPNDDLRLQEKDNSNVSLQVLCMYENQTNVIFCFGLIDMQ